MDGMNKKPGCLRHIIFSLLLIAFIHNTPSALGATYDATGIWNYTESGVTNNCPDGDTDAEKGTVGIIQNEDTFILEDEHGISTGRVSGAEYSCSQVFYQDWGIVEQHIHVTLSSSTQGSGAVEWTWSDGYDECSGGCSIYITKSGAEPKHDITGIWSYSATNTWNDCGDSNDTVTGYVTVSQNENTFRFTDDRGTHSGVASGVTYVCSVSYPEDDGTTTESIIFVLTSASSGSGKINWTWTDGYESCSGIDSLTISKTVLSSTTPYTPTLISPAEGSTSGCTPQLTTGNFSDPDSGDTHLQTEWQIGGVSNFSSTAFVKISQSNLTSLNVPQFVLASGTTYYWRVRYYDNHSMASAWSGVSSFSTLTTNWDQNGNGIPDNYEPDTTVDLNNDGTPDINQTGIIKSLDTKVDVSRQMGVSGVIAQIEYVDTIDPAEISNISRPYLPFGLMPISLDINRPTDTAGVTVYFSEPGVRSGSSWYMYDPNSGWIDYTEHATFYTSGSSVYCVQIGLKDWGFGDADGIPNAKVIKVAAGAGCTSWIDIRVTDSFTKQGILNAQVKVNIWDHVLPEIKEGYYLGMISPGTYTLTVSAPGYKSIQTSQINLLPCETVTRHFELEKEARSMAAIYLLLLDD
jgi:hypothetical protein